MSVVAAASYAAKRPGTFATLSDADRGFMGQTDDDTGLSCLNKPRDMLFRGSELERGRTVNFGRLFAAVWFGLMAWYAGSDHAFAIQQKVSMRQGIAPPKRAHYKVVAAALGGVAVVSAIAAFF